MDTLNWLSAVILGVVEGLTEFIPVSSTGHMILVGNLLGLGEDKTKVFEVFIQLGAILAVVVVSFGRFRDLLDFRSPEKKMSGLQGCWRLFLSTLPFCIVGAIFYHPIKDRLFGPFTVMIGFAVGGVAILAVERFVRGRSAAELDEITPAQALAVGCCQCLALWPGMSRAACTIMGGMVSGLRREAAVRYSFLAAVPAMCAAVGYELLKNYRTLTRDDAPIFALGFAVSFVVALAAIRFFLGLLARWDLRPFGYYRIAVAVVGMLWFYGRPAAKPGEAASGSARGVLAVDALSHGHPKATLPAVESEPLPEKHGFAYRLHAEEVMGSGFNATIVLPKADEPRARAALAASLAAAKDLEKLISKYDPKSEVRGLAGLPPGEMRVVSPQTFRAILLSQDLWRRSGGAFDCTVGPLIKLYKYTGAEERLPSDDELHATLARVGTDKLLLDRETRAVGFKVAGMELDLGAVGQGFGADVACDELRKAGAAAALVELGGEVASFGEKWPGHPWEIDVVHPRDVTRKMCTVKLTGNAVSTSGDYEKCFLKQGRRASHILDARTGRPLVGGAVSVTILAPECILADGLATAVSALGPAEGLKLIASCRAEGLNVEAVVIEETADGRLVPHFTPGLVGKVKLDLELPAAPNRIPNPGKGF